MTGAVSRPVAILYAHTTMPRFEGGKHLSAVKKRKKPNDKIYTPSAMAQHHIDMTNKVAKELGVTGPWLDPFRGKGAYYDQFPKGVTHEWCEIDDGVDFFDYDGNAKVHCSNPPFSLINPNKKGSQSILRKCIETKPQIVSLLIGVTNFSIPRYRLMVEGGYHVHSTCQYLWTAIPFDVALGIVWVRSDAPFDHIRGHIDVTNSEPSKRDKRKQRMEQLKSKVKPY